MSTASTAALPIDALRAELQQELQRGPVVVTAPTGTGKSTQVPRWLSGKTLVIQPRRVAARNVAARIAELEGVALGAQVGYRVRDEDCSRADTRVLVVTPGIVLNTPGLLNQVDNVVLDEVHERRLDTDLILALLLFERQKQNAQGAPHIIAMSATVQGERIAEYLGGAHVSVSGRHYPVEVHYADTGDLGPRREQLGSRVRRALEGLGEWPGDVLVFVPGKAEIQSVCDELEGVHGNRLDVRALHGGLSLDEQARALRGGDGSDATGRRRVVVTTNVAETSLTVPGVRVVIDSGLVRRTSYHEGRSYLGLAAIAMDSAEQRVGRAGRTGPGLGIRLWSSAFQLEPETLPEIRRQSLAPLLLSVASLGLRPEQLSFLEPPRDFALADARVSLTALGALDEHGVLTSTGRELTRLPLDPWLSRVLVAAREHGCLSAAIDLVAALEHPRADVLSAAVADDELERTDCDLTALITAVRHPDRLAGAARGVARDARQTRKRLRSAFGVGGQEAGFDRDLLLRAIVAADNRTGCVARRRKSRLSFSSGGTEMELDRGSRVQRRVTESNSAPPLEALVVLATRALTRGALKRQLLITSASAVSLAFLAKAGLGQERVSLARVKSGRLIVEAERIWAGKVIAQAEVEPEGDLARSAIGRLFMQGTIHQGQHKEAERRLSRRRLAAQLGKNPDFPYFSNIAEPPALEIWLQERLLELGVESGGDLDLLSPGDLLPDDVPAELAPTLDDRFPLEVDVGDCRYRAEYDLDKRQVLLSVIRGSRKTPPQANYLPRFDGMKLYVEAGGVFHLIRR